MPAAVIASSAAASHAKVAPSDQSPRTPRESKAPKKPRCPQCCSPFLVFVLFGLVVVPIAVFAFSAFFALILWGLECAETTDPEAQECDWHDSDCVCSYYQWWIYIIGNLVGVGITDVGPEAGHVLAELVDLLIAVWSITITGLVIGLVGGLAWVTFLAEGADASLASRFDKMLGFSDAAKKAAEEGFDFAAFCELIRENGVELEESKAKAMFEEADADSSGIIDKTEVDALLEKMMKEQTATEPMSGDPALIARMDAMDAKLDKLMAMMAKMDTAVSDA